MGKSQWYFSHYIYENLRLLCITQRYFTPAILLFTDRWRGRLETPSSVSCTQQCPSPAPRTLQYPALPVRPARLGHHPPPTLLRLCGTYVYIYVYVYTLWLWYITDKDSCGILLTEDLNRCGLVWTGRLWSVSLLRSLDLLTVVFNICP